MLNPMHVHSAINLCTTYVSIACVSRSAARRFVRRLTDMGVAAEIDGPVVTLQHNLPHDAEPQFVEELCLIACSEDYATAETLAPIMRHAARVKV